MQVSVEAVSNIKKALTVTIPAAEVDDKVTERMQQAAKTMRLPGFQPGRVPLPVVKKRFGDAIRQEVLGDVLQEKYYAAITQEKVHAVGMPKIDFEVNETGKDLVFKAECEIFPEIKLDGLDKIKVEKWSCKIAEKNVKEMFERLRKQHAEWKPVKREAKNEDQLKIDFEGFMGGEKFEGGSAQDMPIVLGSASMIPGFEEGLVGKKAGEETTLKVTFPKEYQAENLAGKKAEFKVNVKEVSEPKLPALDDAFAEKFGVKDMAELDKEVRANMDRELEFSLSSQNKTHVTDALLEANDIEVPEALIHQEMDQLKRQAFYRMGLNDQDIKNKKVPELPEAMFKPQAEKRVKLGILMNSVVREHDLKPDEQRVNERIQKMASAYENADEMVQQIEQNANQKSDIEQAILEDQVIEKLLAEMEVTEKKVDFFKIMESMGQDPSMMMR